MKALSLWQPWASLIAFGEKRIETRHWQTSYRGPILIHAAKTREGILDAHMHLDAGTTFGCGWPFGSVLKSCGVTDPNMLPLGAFVAVANLVDIQPTETVLQLYAGRGGLPMHERAFGNYDRGRYGWVLNGVRPLTSPLPARGRQGLWTPDEATRDAVRERLQPPLPGIEPDHSADIDPWDENRIGFGGVDMLDEEALTR